MVSSGLDRVETVLIFVCKVCGRPARHEAVAEEMAKSGMDLEKTLKQAKGMTRDTEYLFNVSS